MSIGATRIVTLSDRPLCHMCRQRVAVTPAAIVVGDDPDATLVRLLRRHFIEHTNEAGEFCSGSGQSLAVARGREDDNA